MGERRINWEITPRSTRSGPPARNPLRPAPATSDPRTHPYSRSRSSLVDRQFGPRTSLSPLVDSLSVSSPPSHPNSPLALPTPRIPSIPIINNGLSSSPILSSLLFSTTPSSPCPPPVSKIDQSVPNPYQDLAKSDVNSHVDLLVSELAHKVGNLINTQPRDFPLFRHCNKTKALVKNMSLLLSPSNPIVPLSLTKSQVCSLISFFTGINPRQVLRMIDASEPDTFCPPCHSAPASKKTKQEKDLETFTLESRGKMRFFIHAQFREQRRPSVQMVMKASEYWLQGSDVGRNVSVSSVRKCMRAMGFSWRKLSTRVHLYLNPGVSSMRNAYLTIMSKVRMQTGAMTPYIAFLDETWLYPGMRHAYGWVDNFADSDPFLAMEMGLTPGLEAEFKKGERLVLIAIFSEDGFIDYKVYRTGKKEDESTRDYHGEMNAQVFEAYAETAFAVLAQKAKEKKKSPVLVIDNASYHGRRIESMPTKSSPKWKMLEFLEEKGIPHDARLKRPELFQQTIAPLDKSKYNLYATEEIAKKHGVRLIRLPPYHCIYSPIELAWAWLKNKAKDQLTVDDVGAVAQRKVEDIFDSFPIEKAPSYLDHCRRKEQDHIDKGSLTFSHADLDPHAFVRAQMRADRDLDTVPADLEDEEAAEGEAEVETRMEEEEDEECDGVDRPDETRLEEEDEEDDYDIFDYDAFN